MSCYFSPEFGFVSVRPVRRRAAATEGTSLPELSQSPAQQMADQQLAQQHQYYGSPQVQELTPQTFQPFVEDNRGRGLIAFTAPWCGHCQKLEPMYGKAADAVSDFKFANVDCTKNEALCDAQGVKGYPTVKAITSNGGFSPLRVNSEDPATQQQLIDYATAHGGVPLNEQPQSIGGGSMRRRQRRDFR
jgi:thiol-disulfide isomerase/thioredoxin